MTISVIKSSFHQAFFIYFLRRMVYNFGLLHGLVPYGYPFPFIKLSGLFHSHYSSKLELKG